MPDFDRAQPAESLTACEARPPALIIRVPPPGAARPGTTYSPGFQLAVLAAFLVFVTALVSIAAVVYRLAVYLLVTIAGGVFLLCVILVWATYRRNVRWFLARKEFLKRFPTWDRDAVAEAIAHEWGSGGSPPYPRTVLKSIARCPVPRPPRARIVCLGLVDVPEIGDLRFEPVIITPTRFLWRRLWAVPAALAVITLWLIQQFHVLPMPVWIDLSGTAYLLFVGIGAAAAWTWRAAVRPTYLRLAPGVVQVLQFGLRRAKPTIRSYPMAPGTVAIVTNHGRKEKPRVTLVLARGEDRDDIPLWQMQRPAEVLEHVWHALLSIAPTPPLSDEELVG